MTDDVTEPRASDATNVPEQDKAPDPTPDAAEFDTGHPAVDAALRPLAHLHERPVDEHADVFDAVNQDLQAALQDGPADRQQTTPGDDATAARPSAGPEPV
ncbi:MAG: hypothetical protein ACRDP1_16500 [Nocardioidaceae bacterium]